MHYIEDASISSSCHRHKPKKETERSGYWGAPYSECDSSLRLTNLTFDYLENNWADEIDFVICKHRNQDNGTVLNVCSDVGTGDSARCVFTVFHRNVFSRSKSHDEDRLIPRTPDEIYSTNRDLAAKMEEIFTRRGIPVVPNLGKSCLVASAFHTE